MRSETVSALGRLQRCELRESWAGEASAFTPWLASPDALPLLGEALGLELELEAQERSVGPFRADILCREVQTGHWVLIENQLERSDHTHLGQLLTYASGLEAVTIVWVVARFTEEHRSALDWLNRITDEHFRFFGVEVELWRIGGSQPAPKFNVVARPNNWSQAVAEAARAIDAGPLSDLRSLQRSYWEALNRVLDAQRGPVSGNRKPQAQSWMTFPIGRQEFHLTASLLRRDGKLRAELHISGPRAKLLFGLLQNDRAAIDRELGEAVSWEEMPDQQDCRIALYREGADLEDEADWPLQHEWLATRLNALHRVFARRLQSLAPSGGETTDQSLQPIKEYHHVNLAATILRPKR
jgi:hypothetical protein